MPAIQFEDLAKQEHAARFGMWIFLGSELLLFAGLFALYLAYRLQYADAFHEGIHHNSLVLGSTNTVVLIVSSFTVAWSIHALRKGNPRLTMQMLAVTMLLGTAFLVIKGIEYAGHFREGIYPGDRYAFEGMPHYGGKLFFTLYYFMTGLHAIHMIGGLAVVLWLFFRVRRGLVTPRYHTDLECGALYWHLVDSIWIFLWPLFYLTG